jgi:endonuclease-3
VTSPSSSELKRLPPEKRIPLLLKRLGKQYALPEHARRLPLLDSLVLTVLSQNTNDGNSGRAFAQLKARFPTWEAVLKAPRRQVAAAIRVGGLAEIKSGRIQQILRRIQQEQGKLDLEFLRQMPVDGVQGYLLSLPGIGRKTAAVLMLFQLDLPVFPVDTHIHRVSKRLGLVPPTTSAERAHDMFDAMLKPKQMFPLHVGLILHGRGVCTARRPRCPECLLLDLCPQVGV